MILHVGEVWLTLAACFVIGAIAGSIAQRTIALTALGRPQARLVRAIDRAIRRLEWRLLPWRATVSVILPRTVPVPPPDFGHVVVDLDVPAPLTAEASHASIVESDPLAELPVISPAPARPETRVEPVVATPKQSVAMALADTVGFRPIPLQAPRNGYPDPLHLIRGVTKRHATRLGQVGIFHFSQIASWTPQELAWISAYLGAGEGPVAKDWVGQAIQFAGSDVPIEVPAKAAGKKRKATRAEPGGSGGGDAPLRRRKATARKPSPLLPDAPVEATGSAPAVLPMEEGGEP